MRWALALPLLTGCRQILGIGDPVLADDSGVPDDEALEDDDAASDAGPATCFDRWLDGSVQLASPVPVLTAGIVRTPHLSDDELTLWYTADPGLVSVDVYRTTRGSRAATFGAGAVAADLSSAADDFDVSLSADALSVVIATERSGSQLLANIAGGQRTNAGQPFGAVGFAQTSAVNTNDDEYSAGLSADGLELFFTREPSATMFVSIRASTASAFAAATPVGTGDGTDFSPSISSDNRILLFDSERALPGNRSLFYATRTARNAVFDAARAVPVVSVDDSEPTLSADGCTLYFTRNTLDGNGDVIDADIVAARVTN